MTKPLQPAGRPRRRKNINRKVPDTSVPSPCLSICMMDDASGVCDGCFRTLDEIREWIIMDKEEKLAVLAKLEQRRDDAIGI
ncbi:MAG: DUF1289 domain-containing protein [Thiolinea sp.]